MELLQCAPDREDGAAPGGMKCLGGLGMEWRYWSHKDGRLQDGGEDHEISEGRVQISPKPEPGFAMHSGIYFCFIDYVKAFVWITINCGKF